MLLTGELAAVLVLASAEDSFVAVNDFKAVPSPTPPMPDHPDDVLALTSFGRSTKADAWDSTGTWLRADVSVCTWPGVSCGASGRVKALKLKNVGLQGALPAELEHLTELETLNLMSSRPTDYYGCGANDLKNSSLAPVFKLANLKDLNVEYACVGGSLEGVEGLKSIESLQLHSNYISGTIPESIGELSNVQTLKFGRNPLTGNIPDSISKLKQLFIFGGNFCAFTGQFPDIFGELLALEICFFDGNGFTGTLPASLGLAKTLKRFSFNINNLTGPLPVGICDIPAGKSGGDCRIGSDTELEPYQVDLVHYPWVLPVRGNFYDCSGGVAPCFTEEAVCNTTHMYPSAAQNYSVIRCERQLMV